MKDLIGEIAVRAVGGSKPVSIVEGEVVSEPPNLKVKLDNNDKLIIPKELLKVVERLVTHEEVSRVTSKNVEGDVYLDGVKHKMTSEEIRTEEMTQYFGESLKLGDEVLVLRMQGGQKYIIIDRLISY